MSQIDRLRESDWNNLIILDACRYDYFKNVYRDFLKGELFKAVSPASCTEFWLPRCWSDYYDYTYVSGTPYVNSMGYPVSASSYVAKKHFRRILDVWKFGWSEKLGTTPPMAINNAVLNMTDKKNLIIHYCQPHWPYIGKTKLPSTNFRAASRLRARVLDKKPGKPTSKGERRLMNDFLLSNINTLRLAYRDNLKLVLKRVSELVPSLKGKIIITADHGDFLGESGMLFHPCNNGHHLLREIPWFEVG